MEFAINNCNLITKSFAHFIFIWLVENKNNKLYFKIKMKDYLIFFNGLIFLECLPPYITPKITISIPLILKIINQLL